MATIGRIKCNPRGPELVATRSSIHQNAATWTAILGIAFALAGVIFTAGDAKQMLTNDHGRVDVLERQVAQTSADLQVLKSQMQDVRETVHHLDGTPVPPLPRR